MALQGKEETYAKWRFVVPKGYPLDMNVSLGKSFVIANISCNVYEKNLTGATWPSPYSPNLSIFAYNLKTNKRASPSSSDIFLIDKGTARNKITTSQVFFFKYIRG